MELNTSDPRPAANGLKQEHFLSFTRLEFLKAVKA
jgi:hypothetical protein